MNLTVVDEKWPLLHPFAISRGVKTEAHVVVVELSGGEFRGRGECVPYPRYGETVKDVVDQIRSLAADFKNDPDCADVQSMLPAGAARNAVDCALWDLKAKRAGKRVWDMLGQAQPLATVTAQTIGIESVSAMAAQAKNLSTAPLLKIKLGGDDVLPRVAAVRENAPKARLVIDPNEAWTVDELANYAPELAGLGVEMIEQPVPAGDDVGLLDYTSPVPVCADEACHSSADLDGLAGKYDMVNIKLDKTGGLTEALKLARRADDLGFSIMVGCMVGTSLAMAPAMVIADRARVVDLDGPLLLKNDRPDGLDFTGGLIHAPEARLWG